MEEKSQVKTSSIFVTIFVSVCCDLLDGVLGSFHLSVPMERKLSEAF